MTAIFGSNRNRAVGDDADPFVARLRLGLIITIASSVLFGGLDQLVAPTHRGALLVLKLTQATAAAGALGLLRSALVRTHAIGLTLAVVTVVCACVAAAGIVTGDALTTPAVCVFLALATATVLQWRVWPQLAVAAISGLAVLWNAHPQMLDGWSALVNYPAALIAIGLASSVYLAEGFARLRQGEARALATLRESEKTLRGIFENMQDVYFRNDLDGTIRMASPSVRQFGYEPEDLIGTTAAGLYVEAGDQKRVRTALLEHGSLTDAEVTLRRKDGRTVVVSASSQLVKDDRGQPIGFEGMLRDISARRQAEEQLRLQSTALEACDNTIVITETDGRIIWVNPAFTRLTGYERDEVIGSNPRVLKSGMHDRAHYEKMWATIGAAQVWSGEVVNRRKDGALYTEEMTITPVRDQHGGVGHFIAIKQDISARKQLEQQREDFIAMIAHDIRHPLSIISGYTNMLLESPEFPPGSEVREILSRNEGSVQVLMSLVTNYLQLAQLEAGHVILTKQPFRIGELLEQVCRSYQSECARHHITLRAPPPASLPTVDGDRVALDRVFVSFR